MAGGGESVTWRAPATKSLGSRAPERRASAFPRWVYSAGEPGRANSGCSRWK
jgi:hypothetical protein